MKKWVSFSILFLMAISLFAGVANAHVSVQPNETVQGTYEVFTVRVPSESEESSTTKVEVRFPAEVNISRFESKPGWRYELQKDESGKITSVTWTADGEGLSPTEFIQFNLQGKVADDATEIVWKAYQTYADGSVVEWVGAEGSDTPASVTTVKPADPSVSHEHGVAAQQELSEDEETTSSNVPFYLAIAALVVALLSLVLALRKRG